jgi:hypothetical protein
VSRKAFALARETNLRVCVDFAVHLSHGGVRKTVNSSLRMALVEVFQQVAHIDDAWINNS